MEMRDLLEKMMKFAGEKVGQKPGDQWRGTDKAPPGKKLVGDSILKDLSKGKTPKTKEQELSEEFQAFLEAEFKDTVDKRPGRKSDRHPRGHNPQPRYKIVKTDEGWESGPEEPRERPEPDPDEWYDRKRQEKIDTEAEKEWAKLPKVSTYKLVGRGPNMEPNYSFGDTEYDSLEAAIEARAKLMADPKTPHPEHIGIQTLTRVKNQTDEAVDSDIVQPMGQDTFNRAGFNPIRDERDYLNTLSQLTNLSRKPGLDKSMQDHITQRIRDLNAEAFKKGYIKAESRGHKIIATKLKDIEREKKFASGELKIPTPQERQAQLKKLEKEPKQVKEYGANNVSPYGQPTMDPKQAATVAQGAQAIKAASGSTAPTTNLAKAIDAASQGKPVGQQDMKTIEPIMKDVKTIMQNPKIASGAFRTALQQANQEDLKLQQMAKK